MGEHNLERTDDSRHQDIPVARSVPHEHHEPSLKLNDIGMVHLQYDVEFTGNRTSYARSPIA